MSSWSAVIRRVPEAQWLAAAGAMGVVAGFAGATDALSPSSAALAVAATAIAVAVVWRVELAPPLIVFTLPLDVAGRIYEGPVTVTLFHLTLLLSLLSWGLRVAWEPRRWLRFSGLDLGMGLLVFAALWSLPNSNDPSATAISTVRLVFLWLFMLLYVNTLRTRTDAHRVLRALGITGFLTSVLVLYQWRFPDDAPGNTSVMATIGGEKVHRVAGFFDDPNYLAGFLTAVVVAALAGVVHARGWKGALLWLSTLVVSAGALIVTYSRTGWVAVLLGIVLVVATAPSSRRAAMFAVSLVLVIAFVAAAPGIVVSRIGSITDVEGDTSVATRYFMLDSTVQIIERDWVWGTGLDAYEHVYPRFRHPETLWGITRPHQLPLALWAEMGVAGLVAELVLLGAFAAQFLRRRGSPWTWLEVTALAAGVTLLVQTLFQYYLYFEYLWLFLALSVVARRLRDREEEAYA